MDDGRSAVAAAAEEEEEEEEEEAITLRNVFPFIWLKTSRI